MTSPMHIYFIKPVGAVGQIKIGCSKFVGDRLASLAMWSPIPLEVIYQEEGGFDVERNIHCCFADLHSHHEWFHPGERLLKAIAKLKAGMKISDAIDLSDQRGSIHKNGGKGPRPECDITKGRLSYKARIRHALNRARKETKSHRIAPDDVDRIIDRWDGFAGYKQQKKPIRPTDVEFARLDEFLAGPVLHSVEIPRKRSRRTSEVREQAREAAQ